MSLSVKHDNQRDRLLKLFSRGFWVSLPRIVEGLGIYRPSARIFELRKHGWIIDRKEIRKGVQRHIFYRLVP